MITAQANLIIDKLKTPTYMLGIYDIEKMTLEEKKGTLEKYKNEMNNVNKIYNEYQNKILGLKRVIEYFEENIEDDELNMLVEKYNNDKYINIAKQSYYTSANRIRLKDHHTICKLLGSDYEYLTREQEQEYNEFMKVVNVLSIK